MSLPGSVYIYIYMIWYVHIYIYIYIYTHTTIMELGPERLSLLWLLGPRTCIYGPSRLARSLTMSTLRMGHVAADVAQSMSLKSSWT